MSVSYTQPMREALKASMDAINTEMPEAISAVSNSLQASINAEVSRASTAENNLTQLYGQLASIVNAIPDFEYGYSDSFSIVAGSSTSVDITFNKTFNETPQVFTTCFCNTDMNIITEFVKYVSTTKCTVKVFNGGTTDVSDVTIDYLALAGR